MKNKLLLVLAVVGFSALVFAAIPKTRAIEHVSPERFKNLIVEPTATYSWDFPALSQRLALNLPCAESDPFYTQGCAIGDACITSSNWGADGGSALPATAMLSCRAYADYTIVRLCALETDGGVMDLGDAGYTTRCIH